MNRPEPQPPPGFLDAIIPGRYFKKRGIHTDERLWKLGMGTHRWNVFTVMWAALLPFWVTVTAICGFINEFGRFLGALLTPFPIIAVMATPVFVVAYPGFYYLHYKQGVSLRHLSHSIFTASLSGMDVIACRHWLAWWRAIHLPGVDIGNLNTRAFGNFFGFAQRAAFLTPLWLLSGPMLVALITNEGPLPPLIEELFTTMLTLAFSPMTLLWSWGISLALFWVNFWHGRKWVEHVANMSPGERAALPL